MMRHVTIGLLILMLFTVGCTMTQQRCEPPAKPMTDVNGNVVCVYGNFTDQGSEETGLNDSVVEKKPENMTAEEYLEELRREAGIDENASDKPDVEQPAENATPDADQEEQEQMPNGEPAEEPVQEAEEMDSEEAAQAAAAALTQAECDELPSRTVTEGDIVSFSNLEATDPDGDPLTYTFYPPLNEDGQWQTEQGDAGVYLLTITVSDGVNNVSRDVLVTVEERNRAPVIGDVGDVTITAGDTVSYPVSVSDPDGDNLTVTFSEPLSNEGEWQTTTDDVGTYEIDIVASDGRLSVSKNFILRVVRGNDAPVIEDLPETLTVEEGDTVTLEPSIFDPNGDNVTVSYSGWMTSSTYTTTYDDAGVHTVNVTADDGEEITVESVEITVEDVNRPPVFDPEAFE